MTLLDRLYEQIIEAKTDGEEIMSICASRVTVVQALTEGLSGSMSTSVMSWRPPYEIFGFKVTVLPLPNDIWVLSFKHRFAGLRTMLGHQTTIPQYIGFDQASDLLGVTKGVALRPDGSIDLSFEITQEKFDAVKAQIAAGLIRKHEVPE